MEKPERRRDVRLEAIVRLGESRFELDVIAIADSLPALVSEALRP